MCPKLNIDKKKKYFSSLLIDSALIGISIILFSLLSSNFHGYGEVVFICGWLFFVLWFGYNHPRRQIFISVSFLAFFWLSSFSRGSFNYFLMTMQTVLVICISVGVYFSVKTSREIHRKLNEQYLKIKEELNSTKVRRDKLSIDIDRLENDIKMIGIIYKITKRMVAAIELDDILNLCVSFFNRNFSFSYYIIFQYDTNKQEYKVLYTSGISDMGWSRIRCLLQENPHLIKDKSYTRLTNGHDEWEDLAHNLPENVKSFITMPLISYGELTSCAILFSNNSSYFRDYIIKYLTVFSGQMKLGIEKVVLYEEVREKSRRDSLTKLFTRSYWEERFDAEIKKAKRYHNTMALLMIDIDFFKKYNDKYGHLVGDEVLKETSSIISEAVYTTDIIGRYGGEEFVILMPMVKREEAIKKAERLRRLIAEKQFFSQGIHGIVEEKITISIGIAAYPQDAMAKSELIEKADKAMYYAKQHGRNRVIDYLQTAHKK
ncbi:GGDEF domain-containing protein [bacterium]